MMLWNSAPKIAGLMALQSIAQASSRPSRITALNEASGSAASNNRPFT